MTRKIKFRGKDILTDKWVYGDLLHLGNAYAIVTSYEEEELKVNPISDRLEIRVEDIAGVYPETVGQLTGLLDKNGTEIYEGDKVRVAETENHVEIIAVIRFNDGKFTANSIRTGVSFSLDYVFRERQSGCLLGEIIGNIHDNPELLKGGAE